MFPKGPSTGNAYIDALMQAMSQTTAVVDPSVLMRTPGFNPNEPQPGGSPGPAPTPPPVQAPMPVPARAGAPAPAAAPVPGGRTPVVPYQGNLGSRLYQGIQDPRLQAFMLNMGNRLLQPPQFGESQAMRMGQGMLSGYQGMNALSVLQTAKAKAAEEARMAREKHEAEVAKTRAETGKITEEGKAIPAATAHKGREVSVLEGGLELDRLIKGGQLDVARGQLSAQSKKNDGDLEVARGELQAKRDRNASDAEIAKAQMVVNARKLDAEILLLHSQAAKVQEETLEGRDATARVEAMKQQVEVVKSIIAAAPMGTDLQPYYDRAQQIISGVTSRQPKYKIGVEPAVPAPGQLASPGLPPSFTAPPQRAVYDSSGELISGGEPVPNQGPPASVPVAPIGGSPAPAPTAAASQAGMLSVEVRDPKGILEGTTRISVTPEQHEELRTNGWLVEGSELQTGAAPAALVAPGPAPVPGATAPMRDIAPGSAVAGQTMGVESVAQAIAQFEGFGKPGSVAQRTNNPGNLRAGPGQIGTDPGGYAIFPDMQTGWAALRSHISRHSTEDLTIREYFGGKPGVYSGYAPAADKNDPENYANVVAKRLGVTPDTKLADVVGGQMGRTDQPAPGFGYRRTAGTATTPPPARSAAATPPPTTSKGPTPAPAGTVSKTPMVKGGPRMLTPEQTEQARQQLSRIPKPTRAKGEGPVEGWVDPRNGQVKWARNMTPARRAALRETGRVPLEEAAAKKERGPEVPYGSLNAPGLPGLP